ncbi:unnamed protein product [Clavelina lepadiformis]|uniref:Uncharacterized protein n=1 Tax=Clavelina lepadiformis TaxID=159417 RepID=A0ABP0FN54_CLALP
MSLCCEKLCVGLVSSTLQRRVKACSYRFGSSDDSLINKPPMIHQTANDDFPHVDVKVELFHILLQLVLEIQGRSTNDPGSRNEFDVLRNSDIGKSAALP